MTSSGSAHSRTVPGPSVCRSVLAASSPTAMTRSVSLGSVSPAAAARFLAN